MDRWTDGPEDRTSVIPQVRSTCRDLLYFAPKSATIAWIVGPDSRYATAG